MAITELNYEQLVPKPVGEVFAFFADAHNLERITPPFLNFRILRTSTPQVEKGTLIWYRLKIHGIPVRWKTLIEDWEPGIRFVDRQLFGPYRLWHHTHYFEPLPNGQTKMTDRIRYSLWGGALADAILGKWVRKDVESIFAYRQSVISDLFGKSELATV